MNGQVQVLRDDRAMRGLTVKQYEYVLQRLEGLGVTDAYTAAYEVGEGVARPTVTVMAAQVEANPKVQALLRERLMEREAVYEGLPVISRDFVLTGIAALAVSGDKESTRLKGYELLGKALGVFDRAPVESTEPRNVKDIDAQLAEKLKSFLGPDTPNEGAGADKRDRRRTPMAD